VTKKNQKRLANSTLNGTKAVFVWTSNVQQKNTKLWFSSIL